MILKTPWDIFKCQQETMGRWGRWKGVLGDMLTMVLGCSSSSSSAGDAARKEIEVGLLHGLSLKKGLGEGLLLQLR
jgi:hypothetical protein